MLKPDESRPYEDPVVRSARLEATATLLIWFLAMCYTVGYAWLYGYGREPEEVKLILGVPDWVLWGIVAPWTVCVGICWWFAYRFMSDADLGAESDAPDDDF